MNPPSTRQLVLLGTASFLAGLLMLAPVATLKGWFTPKDKPQAVQMFGLQGTLAQGSLSGLQVNNRPALGDLRWNLQPLWLLLGRMSFHVEGGEQMTVNGSVSFSPLGTLRLRNFIAAGSVKPVLAAVGQGFLPVDGQARLDLKGLKLRKGALQDVDGVIEMQSLAWTLAREPIVLGDYRAELSTENNQHLVKIESVSGPLELSGNGKLGEDKVYEFEIKLKPKPEASPMLRNLVNSAGQPDTQGYYLIRKSGKLAQ